MESRDVSESTLFLGLRRPEQGGHISAQFLPIGPVHKSGQLPPDTQTCSMHTVGAQSEGEKGASKKRERKKG